ncbi:MAG: FAD-dependent oxidoreductase [bacterium]
MKNNKVGAVLVVGGGIGGMRASFDLAEMGFKVYLLDRQPSLGGVLSQLDKWFPDNSCAMCQIMPSFSANSGSSEFCLRNYFQHPNIDIITYSDLEGVSGSAGNFSVSFKRKALYVNKEKCTGCGICVEKCPVELKDEFNEGLGLQKAIYVRYPQATPPLYLINLDKCTRCGICEKYCGPKAIEFSQQDTVEQINVGAIILAAGLEEFDPRGISEYGYGRFPNVVTSIELERMFSGGGPFKGMVVCPSDGKMPKKIGFIQCVGSRDHQRKYCSSVCCMYATKEAMLVKKIIPEVDCRIFFMDMRTYGKSYDEYYNKAVSECGVEYIRCRPSAVEEIPGTKSLRIIYETEAGRSEREDFDLIVLSVGLQPSDEAQRLSKILDIELTEDGFFSTHRFSRIETEREGIYICGTLSEPKDIPETVTEASSAAAKAASLLSEVRGRELKKKVYPEELDVTELDPRIGIFLCRCGTDIAEIIDLKQVSECAKGMPDVVWVEENPYLCKSEAQEKIKKIVTEEKLNRVVVALCSPRLYKSQLIDTVREAGLASNLLELVNIREQCSWVHRNHSEVATEKAKNLVAMAIAKSRYLSPIKEISTRVTIEAKGLVIGGGLAGFSSSLALAEQGFEVFLVERESQLGGNLRHIFYALDGGDPQKLLKEMIKRVENHKLIHVYKNAEIKEISGSIGSYKTTIEIDHNKKQNEEKKGQKQLIEIGHGTIIVATGGAEYQPEEYLYGKEPRVITQKELEERIARDDKSLASGKNIVMIQCVGSRDDRRPYCSRICCSQAIKNALKIKGVNPNSNIFILYRDIRTYGFKEKYYLKARNEGIIFIRYDLENKPTVSAENGRLRVQVKDLILDERVMIEADLVVLSTGIIPRGSKELAKLLNLPLTSQGFFAEANVKFRPVDFVNDGVFLCGLAHSPRFIDESISQAEAAAARAATILSKDHLEAREITASVKERWCSGCGICILVCPYEARTIDDETRVAKVTEALCRGCGACAAACPNGASVLRAFEKGQILSMVDVALGS